MTIAGFDPSNGAGLTADVKTFEALRCYGLSVCSANTIQNDITFKACQWINVEFIQSQIEILFERFSIDYVKIGLVENWKVLSLLIDNLLKLNNNIKIILDPILKSSTHYQFHDTDQLALDNVLKSTYLMTPNYREIEQLYPEKSTEETITHISQYTNLLLKGGHRKTKIGQDQLFTNHGKQYTLNAKLSHCSEKHGSGCVLSSAIASYLALGYPLLKACYRGKRYTEKVLASNKNLLGYHG